MREEGSGVGGTGISGVMLLVGIADLRDAEVVTCVCVCEETCRLACS